MIRAIALVVALGACERDHHDDPPRPRDAAIACEGDRDCPRLPAGSTCEYTCGPNLCQLVVRGTRIGAGPCYGDRRDSGLALGLQTVSMLVVACDVNAGVYCERPTKRCAAVKPVGAVCQTDDECGVDGRCDDVTLRCMRGEPAGAACEAVHCAAGLYCDEHALCAPRRALGATCELSEECASFTCDRAHCIATPAPVACPVAI